MPLPGTSAPCSAITLSGRQHHRERAQCRRYLLVYLDPDVAWSDEYECFFWTHHRMPVRSLGGCGCGCEAVRERSRHSEVLAALRWRNR
jgi:hypothetical protein